MANRTVNINGLAYGNSGASIVVTVDGATIFSGAVNTLPGSLPELPNSDLMQQVYTLCSFELPMDFVGIKPMTYAVTDGLVVFADVTVNYVTTVNPIYTSQELEVLRSSTATLSEKWAIYSAHANPAMSAEDETLFLDPTTTQEQRKTLLTAHNCRYRHEPSADMFKKIGLECRINTMFNGEPDTPNPADRGEWPGTWWWTLQSNDTFTYDLVVPVLT